MSPTGAKLATAWLVIAVWGLLVVTNYGQSTLSPLKEASPPPDGTDTPSETELATILAGESSTLKMATIPAMASKVPSTLEPEIATSLPTSKALLTEASTVPVGIILGTTLKAPAVGTTSKANASRPRDDSSTTPPINFEVEFILIIILTVIGAVIIFLIAALIVYCIVSKRREKMSQHFVSFKKKSRGNRYERVEREMAKGTLPRGADQPSGGWIFQHSPGLDQAFDLPMSGIETEVDIEPSSKDLEINGNLDKGSVSDYPGSDLALGLAAPLELEDEEEDLNPMYKTFSNSSQADDSNYIESPTDDIGIEIDEADTGHKDMHSFLIDEPEKPVEL